MRALRAARRRREVYIGPWLPEPVMDEAPTDEGDLIDTALMVALERLSPLERAAFLLHDVFGVDFAEIGAARGVRPILLLDDVSSELDRERTRALFSFLRAQEGQVLLTTTRPELIDIARSDERVDYTVCGGAVSPLVGG